MVFGNRKNIFRDTVTKIGTEGLTLCRIGGKCLEWVHSVKGRGRYKFLRHRDAIAREVNSGRPLLDIFNDGWEKKLGIKYRMFCRYVNRFIRDENRLTQFASRKIRRPEPTRRYVYANADTVISLAERTTNGRVNTPRKRPTAAEREALFKENFSRKKDD